MDIREIKRKQILIVPQPVKCLAPGKRSPEELLSSCALGDRQAFLLTHFIWLRNDSLQGVRTCFLMKQQTHPKRNANSGLGQATLTRTGTSPGTVQNGE